MPEPKIEDISDTWIGPCENDLYYFRLTLERDGTGLCSKAWTDQPAQLYKVTKWTLKEYDIEIELTPIDSEAEQIWLKGTADGWHLNLEFGGMKNDWKRKLMLSRESSLIERMERVKKRMEKEK